MLLKQVSNFHLLLAFLFNIVFKKSGNCQIE